MRPINDPRELVWRDDQFPSAELCSPEAMIVVVDTDEGIMSCVLYKADPGTNAWVADARPRLHHTDQVGSRVWAFVNKHR